MNNYDYKSLSKRVIFTPQSMNSCKKNYTLMDMHVHTKYSHDSMTNIQALIKSAAKLQIGFAVTDHIRAEGAVEASRQKKVFIIPGIEIASRENKEILLYFYSPRDLDEFYLKFIKHNITIHKTPRTGIGKALKSVRSALPMSKIMDKAEEYSCLKGIPHPYTTYNRSSHSFFGKRAGLLRRIDSVEVLNAAHRKFMNRRALKWAVKKDKAFTAGSDAHALRELGSATVVVPKVDNIEDFLDAIRKRQNFIIGREMRWPSVFKDVLKSVNSKRKNGWDKISDVD